MSSNSGKEAAPKDPIAEEIRRLMTELDHILRHFTEGEKLELALARLDRWKRRAKEYLRENVSEGEAYEFSKIRTKAVASPWNTTKQIEKYMTYLRVFCEDRETRAQLTSVLPARSETGKEKPTINVGREVFIVHGHDQGTKEQVTRFIERLELEPIILHEKPSKGRTIIEKFEDYSDVAYAVILLTADDVGKLKSHKGKGGTRARQNVVFELGFFIGKLDRKRVCALYEEGVELPSDFKGVLYIPLDDKGAWKFSLAKELKAVGLKVDLNAIV